LHHSLNFRNQDVFLFLLSLSVFVFTLNFGVFELTYFCLKRLIPVVNFSGLFLSLLKFLFESLQLVFVFLLLLLRLLQLESFGVEIELNLLGLLLNLGFFSLVEHQRLVHLIELLFVDVASAAGKHRLVLTGQE
jgi:hypothetical protein